MRINVSLARENDCVPSLTRANLSALETSIAQRRVYFTSLYSDGQINTCFVQNVTRSSAAIHIHHRHLLLLINPHLPSHRDWKAESTWVLQYKRHAVQCLRLNIALAVMRFEPEFTHTAVRHVSTRPVRHATTISVSCTVP